MQCPGCGLYHPARYDTCVSCGRKLDGSGSNMPQAAVAAQQEPGFDEDDDEYDDEDDEDNRPRRKQDQRKAPAKSGKRGKKGLPLMGLTIAAGLLLASAGGFYFFLSRPPENDRLLSEGQKELANGQYAFAQKTLEQALTIKPDDARILMSLARAYVGTDQVEKAWSCISQAQKSGNGLVTDPSLTSDLAKYYVQRNQYSRAAELLRPLATQGIPHKKAELSDLDALWGDDCFNKGDTSQALKCWEEIKALAEGSRFNEVDTRLATIYQKMSNELLAKDDVEGALKCLNNLNTIAPSPQSFEKTAELYSKQGKYDLAIEQLKQAQKVGNGSRDLNHKLAAMMSKRGKELLDSGETDKGYAYLQQAQGFDSSMKVPTVALRSVNVNFDNLAGMVRASGDAWNPGPNAVSYMSVKTELFDTKASQSIWTKEQKVVDEFVAPLQAKESRQFELSGPLTGSQDGLELRVYLDGSLYKTYPLGGSAGGTNTANGGSNTASSNSNGNQPPGNNGNNSASAPPLAPNLVPIKQANQQLPPPSTANPNLPPPSPTPGMTPEERTLKDLE